MTKDWPVNTPKETTRGKTTSSFSRRQRLANKSPETEYGAAADSADY
jgi:hypothetical protein